MKLATWPVSPLSGPLSMNGVNAPRFTCTNISAKASIHQLHQFLSPEIPIRLRRVKSAFSAAQDFERGGGFELL